MYIKKFKLDFLRNYCADLNQILYESFQVQGNENRIIYWAKVLPEQWELLQISRNMKYLEKKLRMHFEQAIIHLSKSLNFILIKCLQISSFVNILEVPTQNVRRQK